MNGLGIVCIAVCCIGGGFSWGVLWTVRNKQPQMRPFALTLNNYQFAITAHRCYRDGGWLRYEDDRGILIAAFPESHIEPPSDAPKK